MPLHGAPAHVAYQMIKDIRKLDTTPALNLASFVTYVGQAAVFVGWTAARVPARQGAATLATAPQLRRVSSGCVQDVDGA